MKKQHGLALLEVLIAVSILGVITLGVMKLQTGQLREQVKTLAAAKVAHIYQLSTQVMFDPLVKLKSSKADDISTWKTNDTIHGLKEKLTNGGYIYLDAQNKSNMKVANFFNGINYDTDKDSCAVNNGVTNERVNCASGLEDELTLSKSFKVKGIKVDGEKQSYFSINHVGNSDVSDVKPTVITIFIDGLSDRKSLKEMNDLALAVSEQVSQIDDIENSAYASIHIADFSKEPAKYDTGDEAYKALLDANYQIDPNMGLAIIFNLGGTQALRSDGMVAMQKNRSLCWNVSVGSEEDGFICQSAISSGTGGGGTSGFIQSDSNLLYQTGDQKSSTKVYRTPVEVIVAAFNGQDIEIAKPVCPTIKENKLLPHLAVVGSSFSNSGFGEFPEADNDHYGDNSVSNHDHTAEMVSGLLFRWKDSNHPEYWSVTGIVGSSNDQDGDEGKNPQSLQIVALRWCEVEKK
ncbi:prepilin-type N-terminal cleavage/methylation domain-containing protein [Shewanella psychrophila]|uniref:Prepilin-type N-terminal cleavage/methylation domain-containing protein n=1 Tax=Shewanella psychrophila TaxID=225848 RepID=A0A1S6HWN2_9GAMM|nr:prepilin-type N-terminal cleavage/methylation domain-containing protein [Shewanella psychrophila]AQS39919.1 prepilin-type N-terminal cleavage/methylation domain-containing protein [Shewanella psychrophila]